MGNLQKTVKFAWWGFKFAIAGGALGFATGLLIIVAGVCKTGLQDQIAVVVICSLVGTGSLGALPCIPAIWFLFLHMIGQVSSAIRNGNAQ